MFQPCVNNLSSITCTMEKKVQNLIWVLVGLVVVIAAITISMAFLFRGDYNNGTYGYGPFGMMGSYGFYGFGILMPVIGAITVVFVLLFVYFLIEAFGSSDKKYGNLSTGQVEDIAKERFARGEITEEEYKKIIETLKK